MKNGMKIIKIERKKSYDKWGDIVASNPEKILGQIDKREIVNTTNPKELLSTRTILYTAVPINLGDIIEGLEVVTDLGNNKYELGAR